MSEEKPEYGWYVGSLIIWFLVFGIIGLGLLLSGLYFLGIFSIFLIIFGIALIIIFLWPGIGLSTINLTIDDEFSLDRILNEVHKIKTPHILDVGCGTGRTVIKLAKTMKEGGNITGIDVYDDFAISGNALETVQKNARVEKVEEKTTFIYGSATEIPFENEKFDIVTLASVLHELHHSKDHEKAIKEVMRVLKPGGVLYIGEWNRLSWQTILYLGIWTVIFKRRQYWQVLLEKHGFRNIQYQNIGGFGHFTAKKL